MTFSKKESLEAQKELKTLFKEYKTTTVFVVQRSVSRSGMTRGLDLYILPSKKAIGEIRKWDEQIAPRRITYSVAKALQWNYDKKKEVLKVGGCGMDMHFHTVNSLSMALFCPKKYDHNMAYKLSHQSI